MLTLFFDIIQLLLYYKDVEGIGVSINMQNCKFNTLTPSTPNLSILILKIAQIKLFLRSHIRVHLVKTVIINDGNRTKCTQTNLEKRD